MPNVPLSFPEYGMNNASNFRWGVPLANNPQRVRKSGHLFTGMTPILKAVSDLSFGFAEYGKTNANDFKWGFSPCQKPQG